MNETAPNPINPQEPHQAEFLTKEQAAHEARVAAVHNAVYASVDSGDQIQPQNEPMSTKDRQAYDTVLAQLQGGQTPETHRLKRDWSDTLAQHQDKEGGRHEAAVSLLQSKLEQDDWRHRVNEHNNKIDRRNAEQAARDKVRDTYVSRQNLLRGTLNITPEDAKEIASAAVEHTEATLGPAKHAHEGVVDTVQLKAERAGKPTASQLKNQETSKALLEFQRGFARAKTAEAAGSQTTSQRNLAPAEEWSDWEWVDGKRAGEQAIVDAGATEPHTVGPEGSPNDPTLHTAPTIEMAAGQTPEATLPADNVKATIEKYAKLLEDKTWVPTLAEYREMHAANGQLQLSHRNAHGENVMQYFATGNHAPNVRMNSYSARTFKDGLSNQRWLLSAEDVDMAQQAEEQGFDHVSELVSGRQRQHNNDLLRYSEFVKLYNRNHDGELDLESDSREKYQNYVSDRFALDQVIAHGLVDSNESVDSHTDTHRRIAQRALEGFVANRRERNEQSAVAKLRRAPSRLRQRLNDRAVARGQARRNKPARANQRRRYSKEDMAYVKATGYMLGTIALASTVDLIASQL